MTFSNDQDNEKKDCLCWLKFQVTGTPQASSPGQWKRMMGILDGVDAVSASASGVPKRGSGQDRAEETYVILTHPNQNFRNYINQF